MESLTMASARCSRMLDQDEIDVVVRLARFDMGRDRPLDGVEDGRRFGVAVGLQDSLDALGAEGAIGRVHRIG